MKYFEYYKLDGLNLSKKGAKTARGYGNTSNNAASTSEYEVREKYINQMEDKSFQPIRARDESKVSAHVFHTVYKMYVDTFHIICDVALIPVYNNIIINLFYKAPKPHWCSRAHTHPKEV